MTADKILFGEHPTTKAKLLHNLEIRGVRIIAECKVDRIDQHSMGYIVCDEDLCTVPMDSVLLATGYKSDSILFDTLKRSEHTKMVYEIGDGKKVRGMTEAIQEGYFLGRYGA
jgi:NADH dehydrogenase FAD-containing subunit